MGWAVNRCLDTIRGAIQPNTPYEESLLEEIFRVAKGSPREKKQEAADRGTQVHRALEAHFRGEPLFDIPEEISTRVNAGLLWLSEHAVEPISIERRVYSRRHKVVGTLDKLAKIDGRLSIIDWKTSKYVYTEFLLQTAAYGGFLEEETGLHVERRYLIRLNEEGEFEVHEYNREDFKRHYSAFLAALKVFKVIRGG